MKRTHQNSIVFVDFTCNLLQAKKFLSKVNKHLLEIREKGSKIIFSDHLKLLSFILLIADRLDYFRIFTKSDHISFFYRNFLSTFLKNPPVI